ncbi:MAG TPA: glycosyltransferase [Myxococcota bacterium]|nr:glycosyltransferase [Myxococcota bacterium]HQK52392.1 glycosyltransferase [Myxococcota bacterium]
MKTLSIVIPVYNERRTLRAILARVLKVDLGPDLRKEILLVDDCSRDGTRELVDRLQTSWKTEMAGLGVPKKRLDQADLRCLFHPVNRGKGAALRTGFEAVTGDFVLVQDADLEYDPNDYPRLLAPLLEGKADVVYGSRFAGDTRRVHFFWHSLGNRFLTFLSNAFTDLNLTDMETCYKAFRADVIRDLHLTSERFGIEPEITAKIARMRYRIYEVPIAYHGRSYAEGKKIGVKDGFEALYAIIRYSWFDSDFLKGRVVEETLSKMNALERFNTHLFRTIRPYLGRRMLEVGSGTGNITRFLLSQGDVTATDISADSIARLQESFAEHDGFKALVWDCASPPPEGLADEAFDTVVCLNVLEHVEDQDAALRHMERLLRPAAGRLVLLVPAHPALYSPLDQSLGHFRRYAREDLEARVRQAGFVIEKTFAFNLLGVAGWFANGRLLKKNRLPIGQLSLYEKMAPVALGLERRFGEALPLGLSWIVVARSGAGGVP